MANKEIKKVPIDKNSFMKRLKENGLSIRKLASLTEVNYNEATIRRYLNSGFISLNLLEKINGAIANLTKYEDGTPITASQRMSMLDEAPEIQFLPVCSKCGHVIRQLVDIADEPVSVSVNNGPVSLCRCRMIVPPICPNCRAEFERIIITTKLPFNGYG